MNNITVAQQSKNSTVLPPSQGILQRKCACGNQTLAGGECAECKKKNSLQRKLSIGASNDPLEREAERVADQVMAVPANSHVNATPHIQRFTGQANESLVRAPDSVDRVLASSGRPLEPALRQDMEQRFGHDFSQVRVHTGVAAEHSARDMSANAYTVGHNIVFGAGQFEPGANKGRRLLSHELTHVVQQGGGVGNAYTVQQMNYKTIQRAVNYDGIRIQNDINPLDPLTAPAGNTKALGHTAFIANGLDFQSLSPDNMLAVLFPLPSFDRDWGDCVMSSRAVNVTVHDRVRLLTAPPWTRAIPRSDLRKLFGGAFAERAECAGSGNTIASLRGNPDDATLATWAENGERQHSRDDECLVDRYLKSYELDVAALPARFSAGYLGLGSCEARLEERLRRRERLTSFVRSWRDWAQDYDGAGGPHHIVARPSIDSGCNTVNVTITTGNLPPVSRNCSAWSPP